MPDNERYRINRPSVIHEILDDELVIVNLKSGAYYSLDGAGAVVWKAIERHASRAEIAADLACRFDAGAAEIEGAVGELLAELGREDLIQPHPEPPAQVFADGAPLAERAPFVPPALHKYTDMQDLLLLDPIHEVDDTGWPSRRP